MGNDFHSSHWIYRAGLSPSTYTTVYDRKRRPIAIITSWYGDIVRIVYRRDTPKIIRAVDEYIRTHPYKAVEDHSSHLYWR